MNIISNDGSNKLNRSRKARVSYKVQRTITQASTQRRARERSVAIQTLLLVRKSKSSSVKSKTDRKSGSAGMPRPISYAVFCLKKKTAADSSTAPVTISRTATKARATEQNTG